MSSKLYRNAVIGSFAVTGAIFYATSKKSAPMETFASQNVANRMSSGGGSHTHTPAVATPIGKANNVHSPQENPKGVDTKHFQENQASQKVQDQPAPQKALSKAVYGQEQGK